GTVDEVVSAALTRGLSMVALTEHLPLPSYVDSDATYAMDADKVEVYLDAVKQARDAHPEIEVICGVEIDWRFGAQDYILTKLAETPAAFELLLGSVHMLTNEDGDQFEFDHPDFINGWYERSVDQVWEQYLGLWLAAVNSAVPFDIMTHPDLPKKFGFKPKFDTRDYYAAMAEAAARRGVMVEVNTSGLRKPVGEIYPATGLLTAFCDAGVACTMGSDAHIPHDVGRDFDKGCAALREAGYTCVTMPTRSGDRRPIPLEIFEAALKTGKLRL
ncbi:MAG: histidinol-phosphatase HisJ family protein, partial [Coriobacteriia bacterium]|nr:histidinol-phosphatase HisJ family protein [Coriobacteriia bacterium]